MSTTEIGSLAAPSLTTTNLPSGVMEVSPPKLEIRTGLIPTARAGADGFDRSMTHRLFRKSVANPFCPPEVIEQSPSVPLLGRSSVPRKVSLPASNTCTLPPELSTTIPMGPVAARASPTQRLPRAITVANTMAVMIVSITVNFRGLFTFK